MNEWDVRIRVSFLFGSLLMLVAYVMIGDVKAADRSNMVDNAVVFVVDASWTMSEDDLRVARSSHAAAVTSSEVLTAIEAGAFQRSAFAYVEFGDRAEVVVNWSVVDSPASAADFADAIMNAGERGYLGPRTAVGMGLAAAETLLQSLPWQALFMTVDVAGDGRSSYGISPEVPRQMLIDMGATINGLPMEIRSDERGLVDWYADNIVGGPRSFLLPLNDINDMPMALRRKLIMELG